MPQTHSEDLRLGINEVNSDLRIDREDSYTVTMGDEVDERDLPMINRFYSVEVSFESRQIREHTLQADQLLQTSDVPTGGGVNLFEFDTIIHQEFSDNVSQSVALFLDTIGMRVGYDSFDLIMSERIVTTDILNPTIDTTLIQRYGYFPTGYFTSSYFPVGYLPMGW